MSGASPKQVLIHVGHGKTGSSYLQSSLALSGDALKSYGIHYPIDEALGEAAGRGAVTSGNMDDNHGSFTRLAEKFPTAFNETVLVSSEKLFSSLFKEKQYEEMRALFPKSVFRVLLFVRDPLENAASSYQQAIKRGQIDMEFSDYLPRFERIYGVIDFIETCRARNIELSILNYSRVKENVLGEFEKWLGVKEDTLIRPEMPLINRSLTRAEQRFQLHLNRLVRNSKMGFLSNELLTRLPNQANEQPLADRAALEEFKRRISDEIARANEVVGYSIYQEEDIEPWLKPDGNMTYQLTEYQIRVIVEAFGKRLAKHLRE